MRDAAHQTVPEAILIVDDDEAVLRSLDRVLREEGFGPCLLCKDPREVSAFLQRGPVALVLLDLAMPHVSGEQVLDMLVADSPDTSVIMITALDQVESAVRCIKAGAFDYLVKPLEAGRLVTAIWRALAHRGLRLENRELKRRLMTPAVRQPEIFAAMVTQSPVMHGIFATIEALGVSREPVLVMGETGTGKELIAEALHRASACAGPLVTLNVASLDDTSFADTLFGHTRGAFTGAERERAGLVARASGGTLFLDEIGELSTEIQTKLLRLVQEREYFPLGSDEPKHSDCRVITATNQNLRARVRSGKFREDLYFRLQSHVIRVPPLRERLEDIPALLDHFLGEAARQLGKSKPTPPRELITYLSSFTFPGNVRELRGMVMDAVTRHDKGVLSLSTFLEHMDRRDGEPPGVGVPGAGALAFGSELPTLNAATRILFAEAMRRNAGNQSAAARALGISRRTLNRYIASGELKLGAAGESKDE